MSKDSYGICCCFLRSYKFGGAKAPQEIIELFKLYSENGMMSADDLQRFMKEVQGEGDVTIHDVEAIVMEEIRKHRHLHPLRRKNLTIEAFYHYLISDINSPLPSPSKACSVSLHFLLLIFLYFFLYGEQLNKEVSNTEWLT